MMTDTKMMMDAWNDNDGCEMIKPKIKADKKLNDMMMIDVKRWW